MVGPLTDEDDEGVAVASAVASRPVSKEATEPDDDDAAAAGAGQAGYAAPVPASSGASTASTSTKKKRRRGPLVVNTSACNGKSSKDLFSLVAQELGWREQDVEALPERRSAAPKPAPPPTIYCVMQTADLVARLPLRKKSWATRYLGLPDLCDKGNFARMLLLCQDLVAPETFAFNPKTWILPDQFEDLRVAMRKSHKTIIVKPEDGSQGDGIFLAQSWHDLEVKMSTKVNKSGVAQRYLDKPLLHKGYKFDFRVYVALVGGSSDSPPRVFLCKEGLARFCTEPYEPPGHKNMHKCMSHLTNYSLNKRSEAFEHSGETLEEVHSTSTTASKRPLTTALKQIEEEHPDFTAEDFYVSLEGLIRTTVAMMAPVLALAGSEAHGGELRSCQVLGFDVMLDRNFAPFLLEVNNSPSLCIDEALPLDPEEAKEFMAKGGRAAGRAGMKTKDGDTVCRCMDMQQVHRHKTALVDLVAKRTVMVGLFTILEQLNEGAEAVHHDDYLEVEVQGDEIHELLTSIQALFVQAGGPSKAFSSNSLRRCLGALCSNGGAATAGRAAPLQKHDLDALVPKIRMSKFHSGDSASKVEALRLYDYLDVLRQVALRAFPGTEPREALDRALGVLGIG